MRNLGFIAIVGAFAFAAGCDTSNATVAPPSPADGGSGGGEASALDSSNSASEAAVSDSAGTDSTVGDTGAGGNDALAADSGTAGYDAANEDSGDGGHDAAIADGGSPDAKAADAGEVDAKAIEGGGNDAGSCALPACLASLNPPIARPMAPCTESPGPNSGDQYSCYSNGVTRADIIPAGEMNTTITAERGKTVCYSITFSLSDVNNQVPTTAVVANGSDAGIALWAPATA